jgi:hypothetical protein
MSPFTVDNKEEEARHACTPTLIRHSKCRNLMPIRLVFLQASAAFHIFRGINENEVIVGYTSRDVLR